MKHSYVILFLALLVLSSMAFQLRTNGEPKDDDCDDDKKPPKVIVKDDCECSCVCEVDFDEEECDDDHHHHHHHHHHHDDDEECDDKKDEECDDKKDEECDDKKDDKKDEDCDDKKDDKKKCKDGKCPETPTPTLPKKCGESQEIYDAWTAAKNKGWQAGKDKCDIMDYCIKGAQDAGASCEMTTCIAAVCGAGTSLDTCGVVDYAVKWAKSQGASTSTATTWADNGMKSIYTWYTDATC